MYILRKTVFISDLHLNEKQPDIANIFFKFLNQLPGEVDALYILGDLFEAWIGDDNASDFNRSVISAFKVATDAGLAIYFMHGNRDFLIGKKFLQATGCVLLGEEEKISLYGTPVLLMHGDSLCTLDKKYLKFRKMNRNPLVQFLFLRLPLSLRLSIAKKMRIQSSLQMQKLSTELMDVTPQEVEHVIKKHRVKYLIHGHTHKPATHIHSIGNIDASRMVLAAWHEKGNALIWDETGNKELVYF